MKLLFVLPFIFIVGCIKNPIVTLSPTQRIVDTNFCFVIDYPEAKNGTNYNLEITVKSNAIYEICLLGDNFSPMHQYDITCIIRFYISNGFMTFCNAGGNSGTSSHWLEYENGKYQFRHLEWNNDMSSNWYVIERGTLSKFTNNGIWMDVIDCTSNMNFDYKTERFTWKKRR